LSRWKESLLELLTPVLLSAPAFGLSIMPC
jgi:hypothetical protein